MNETLEVWIYGAIFIGLLAASPWMWSFASDRKTDSDVAKVIFFILFSFITFIILQLALELLKEIYYSWWKSWGFKIISSIGIGGYLAHFYVQKLKQREHDKKIVKVVVYWGINDNKKPSEYYTREVIPANRDKFSEAEVNAIYKDMDIMRNLTMLGKGQFS